MNNLVKVLLCYSFCKVINQPGTQVVDAIVNFYGPLLPYMYETIWKGRNNRQQGPKKTGKNLLRKHWQWTEKKERIVSSNNSLVTVTVFVLAKMQLWHFFPNLPCDRQSQKWPKRKSIPSLFSLQWPTWKPHFPHS